MGMFDGYWSPFPNLGHHTLGEGVAAQTPLVTRTGASEGSELGV